MGGAGSWVELTGAMESLQSLNLTRGASNTFSMWLSLNKSGQCFASLVGGIS